MNDHDFESGIPQMKIQLVVSYAFLLYISMASRLAPGTRQVNGTGRVLLDSANSADSASPSWTRAESAESKLRKKSLKNHKKKS